MVIEIDGNIHEHRKSEDWVRDEVLTDLGYKVLRIKNEDVLNSDKKFVVELEKFLEL